MTRMEKWKNEKLNILTTRLLEAFPEYKFKYPYEKDKELSEINLNNTDGPELFSIEKASSIIEEINSNESNEMQSLQYIESFDFSSGELDNAIAEVKVGKVAKVKYIDIDKETHADMKFKYVSLPKGEKNE
ncbi:hypothetical protein C4B25_04055 [Mycoplasma todarodis]|uniref:Uncharacterized protein n=2 Tax=Mycoplasma todarodis TaxID=1937191 RepID=A0A4R0XSA8_9MOLU|nr:hypothetical protein C4B25_04055 [Mycoplasma todarodis]